MKGALFELDRRPPASDAGGRLGEWDEVDTPDASPEGTTGARMSGAVVQPVDPRRARVSDTIGRRDTSIIVPTDVMPHVKEALHLTNSTLCARAAASRSTAATAATDAWVSGTGFVRMTHRVASEPGPVVETIEDLDNRHTSLAPK
jgi:hypothetical protein